VVLVVAGGLIALLGVSEKRGAGPSVDRDPNPVTVLLSSISIAWKKPKVGLGGIVAAVTTTSEFGFLVCLPIFYTHTVGFTLAQWLRILSMMFATNVVFNLFWGIVGDVIGWRKTITFAGSCGCALTTLGLYYVPHIFGADYLLVTLAGMAYGIALAGYVPIAAIMATLAPESRCASMSIMNLGSGVSIWLGPAIVGLCLPQLGVEGVIWIFAGMYMLAGFISYTLKPPSETTSSGLGQKEVC
jgi:MFS family permease